MRSKLSRHIVLATVAAAILIAPLSASAAPEAREPKPEVSLGAAFEALVTWTSDLLRLLWAEEGASIDPLGRPGTATAAADDGGRV